MSTQATEPSGTQGPEQTQQTGQQQPTPPAPVEAPKPSQTETVDWKAKSREWERRAKENSEAARRLAEIEDAQKSEAQKSADALAKERARAEQAERRASALEIATEHQLSKDDAELLIGLPDEESMRRLAERLSAQAEQGQPPNGQQGPARVGYGVDHSKTQSTPPPSKDDAARAFFGI